MFIPVLTDLEAALQYILWIIRCLRKTDCSSGRCESWKKLPWTFACGSCQETKWRNIKTISELSDDEET